MDEARYTMLRQLRLVMANTITSFICSLQTIVSKREKDLLIDKEPNSVAQEPNRRPPNSTPQTLYLEILIPKQEPLRPKSAESRFRTIVLGTVG